MMEPILIQSKSSRQANQIEGGIPPALLGQLAGKIKKPWALTGCINRRPNIIRSLFLEELALETFNKKLQQKYKKIAAQEVRCEAFNLEDAEFVLVAYGTMARIAKNVCVEAKKYRIGLLRPITLWPFPYKIIESAAKKVKKVLVVEMSCGQLLEDVILAVGNKSKVEFLGRSGGGIPAEQEIISKIKSYYGKNIQSS